MNRRYRHIPLSNDRLNHYERMHYHVTRKRFGEYTDVDLDIATHCESAKVPLFLIHNPRRFCSVDLDWNVAGIQLTLPGYQQVKAWAQQALDASPAPKKQKSEEPLVGPKGLVVHGLEVEHAKQLCRQVWDYLATNDSEVS